MTFGKFPDFRPEGRLHLQLSIKNILNFVTLTTLVISIRKCFEMDSGMQDIGSGKHFFYLGARLLF